MRCKRRRGSRPVSGALYKHFSSKEELLAAGIDRELVAPRGRADGPAFWSPISATSGRSSRSSAASSCWSWGPRPICSASCSRKGGPLPEGDGRARRRLIDPAYDEFAEWLWRHTASGAICVDDVHAAAAVALGAIVQYRAIEALLGAPPAGQDEESFLQAW